MPLTQLSMAGSTPVLPAAPASPAAALAGGGAIPTAGTVIQDCADCPELLAIPPGEFVMGSSPRKRCASWMRSPHIGAVAASIAVGKYEITRAQYATFVKETGRESKPGCHSTRGGFFHKNPKATWQNPGFEQKE
jgi:formylglycine-generating enzyme required for sulfatase activity